jgi:hypothetical protein
MHGAIASFFAVGRAVADRPVLESMPGCGATRTDVMPEDRTERWRRSWVRQSINAMAQRPARH